MMQMSISTNDGFLAATSTEEGLLAAGVVGALEKKKDIMRKKWAVRGGLLALGAIAPAVWLVWRPISPTPGALEANGRIEGDQAAVGAKAAKDHARYRELFARETIAAQQLDQAKAADEVARATVEAALKQVAQAEEALELARASRVAVALRQKEVQIAVEQVHEARAAVETAQAQVQSTEANRLLAQANLKDTRVVAPFTGTVIKKLVQVGTERVLRGARCPLLEIPALRKDALETVRQQ